MQTEFPNKDVMLDTLLQAHIGQDRVVIERSQKILAVCAEQDMTVQEIADLFDMHYQTVYKNIVTLQQLDLLHVQPVRRGRSNLYRTNWNLVKHSRGELRWRGADGEFQPISYWIERFIGVGAEAAKVKMANAGFALVAIHVNKNLQEDREPNYGPLHNNANRETIADTLEFFRSIIEVLEQTMISPIWDEHEGHKLFNLPASVDPARADAIHDQMEKMHQASLVYE